MISSSPNSYVIGWLDKASSNSDRKISVEDIEKLRYKWLETEISSASNYYRMQAQFFFSVTLACLAGVSALSKNNPYFPDLLLFIIPAFVAFLMMQYRDLADYSFTDNNTEEPNRLEKIYTDQIRRYKRFNIIWWVVILPVTSVNLVGVTLDVSFVRKAIHLVGSIFL